MHLSVTIRALGSPTTGEPPVSLLARSWEHLEAFAAHPVRAQPTEREGRDRFR
jgi:hypothetical protein